MTIIKIGHFPGAINEFGIEDGTTVREALKTAGIAISTEQEVKIDGEAVDLESTVPSGAKLLLVTKRIKGAC